MAEELYQQIWQLSQCVNDQASYRQLKTLTKQLIAMYDAMDRLVENPFHPTTLRQLSLPQRQLNEVLSGSICLVTGGVGCVGSALVAELLSFDVKRVILLDNSNESSVHAENEKVLQLQCDVRNLEDVLQFFKTYKPQFVFHTAAQRNPGLAELYIAESFSTNVLGTLNIVKACEQTPGVQQCVFSSTGKASRYYTNEVYAQTKKICEYILDTYARQSNVRYSIVRFTHILENSLMNMELKEVSRTGDYVAIHSPGKYVTAQNVKEAAVLMLNGLLYSEDKQCNFLIVRNLEWPVESLEMALYYIKTSGRDIPVIFKGNPPGYCEKFFRGQLDWAHPSELNLLINVYEYRHRRLNSGKDIIISQISPVNNATLEKILPSLLRVGGEQETKACLSNALGELVKDSLCYVDKQDTAKILLWGLEPKCLASENTTISDFTCIVALLSESLEGTPFLQNIEHLLCENDEPNRELHY